MTLYLIIDHTGDPCPHRATLQAAKDYLDTLYRDCPELIRHTSIWRVSENEAELEVGPLTRSRSWTPYRPPV